MYAKIFTLSAKGCLCAALALALTACNKQSPSTSVKPNGLPKAGQNAPATGNVAIVDIDSLATQYDYCKAGQKQLESKQEAYRKQLNAKGEALQKAMMNFQQKLQNNGFTSQQQAEAAQAALQKQQQQLQSYQEKVERDLAAATSAYQETLRDSLRSFLKEYNADGRFKVILSKSGDNVLYTDPGVDITNDVVAGLNKRYNKH